MGRWADAIVASPKPNWRDATIKLPNTRFRPTKILVSDLLQRTMSRTTSIRKDAFLVCGLGSLGQYCVSVLKEFGVSVHAIDHTEIKTWTIPDLPNLIDLLVTGDCCLPTVLTQAKIHTCRTILIVTSDEQVNIEAAFAARSLDPDIRIIVRSGQDNLNELLRSRLGNFAAFDAPQIPAPSFALAALAGQTRGFFTLNDQLLRVVRLTVEEQDSWHRRGLYQFNNSTRLLLTHTRPGITAPQSFYQWNSETQIQAGDSIVYIEVTERSSSARFQSDSFLWQLWQTLTTLDLRTLWLESSQARRVGFVSGLIILNLFFLGAIAYQLYYPQLSSIDALSVALALILGGYESVFGHLQVRFFNQPVPVFLYLLSASLTFAGTVFVGIFYAFLTERILSARFEFTRRRPVPKSDHIVLVGLGRVGHQITTLLEDLKQSLVCIHATPPEPTISAQVPLLVGSLKSSLSKANLATAKSILAVTDDEVVNLEIALTVQAINPSANLVIRTFKPSFQENVARLLPTARIMGAYELAAEAFVAAAFGENILNLFRLNNQTLLVTEYQVAPTDSLNGLLLADVAFGYEVLPILHQRKLYQFMPSHEIRLESDDRLVIITSIEGIQRIERGDLLPKSNWVEIEKAVSQDALFEGVQAIARITGCDLGTARTTMGQLPTILQIPLYPHQADRLIRVLNKAQVKARLFSSP
jgi:Trk K+ transport system NAD-binding subunit